MQKKDEERKLILHDKIQKAITVDYQEMSLKQINFAIIHLEKLIEIAEDFKIIHKDSKPTYDIFPSGTLEEGFISSKLTAEDRVYQNRRELTFYQILKLLK